MPNIDPSKLSKKTKDFYVLENNTFKSVSKNNPKDKIEVEIGDSKQPDFKPQFKFIRWDNEVNFSLRAEEHPQATIETDKDGKIKYITPEYEVHQYDKPGASEDGGFEFEWVLPKKPSSNVLIATIQTKGLNFFYQPPLTQQEIDEGVVRPDNVVGSYAAYHSTKGGVNHADGMKYKVGKAFHIYRPKVTDVNGVEIWGELNVDESKGELTVTIDQTWLDNAVYPVVVDPTFGYTSIGGTSASSSQAVACKFTAPGENGDISTISVYSSTASGTQAEGAAIYSDSAGSASAKLVEDSGNATATTTPAWLDITVTYSFTAGVVYWLARFANSVLYYYDTGSTNQQNRKTATFETWPDPFAASAVADRVVSIYATYAASGGSSSRTNGIITTNPFFWGF